MEVLGKGRVGNERRAREGGGEVGRGGEFHGSGDVNCCTF